MSDSITTKADGTTLVTTAHQSGESAGAWGRRHTRALDGESIAGIDELESCWPNPSAPGGECCSTTTRLSGESDESFRVRHELDYAFDMVNCKPIPETPPS